MADAANKHLSFCIYVIIVLKTGYLCIHMCLFITGKRAQGITGEHERLKNPGKNRVLVQGAPLDSGCTYGHRVLSKLLVYRRCGDAW